MTCAGKSGTNIVVFARLHLSACFLAVMLAGCSERGASDAEAAKPIEVCALLSGDEIKSIQGEAPQETQPRVGAEGELLVSECRFILPTPASSLTVKVAQASAGETSVLNEHLDEVVRRAESQPLTSGRERRKVEALGERAYWTGESLYVLQRGKVIQITAGGEGTTNARIDRAETLAEFILNRL